VAKEKTKYKILVCARIIEKNCDKFKELLFLLVSKESIVDELNLLQNTHLKTYF